MAVIFGKVKCCFCEEKSGIITSVCKYGIYGEIGKRIFYHDECLQLVEKNPEKFGHALVNFSLYIHELREQATRKYNKDIKKNFKKKVELLQQKGFERMMPKKDH